MRRDRVFRGMAGLAFAVSIILKMIFLEPVNLGIYGLSITVVASLLPVALLLRAPGVPVIAAACGIAHWWNRGDLVDALVASVFVGVAAAAAYLVLRGNFTAGRWIMAGWVVTALLSLSMAAGYSLAFTQVFRDALWTVFWSVWVAVNLVGVPVSILVSRLGATLFPLPESPIEGV